MKILSLITICFGLSVRIVAPLSAQSANEQLTPSSQKFEQEVKQSIQREALVEAKQALQSRSAATIESKLLLLCVSKPGTAGFKRELAQRWLVVSEETAREGGIDVKALAVQRSLALCEQGLKLTDNHVEQSHILLQIGLIYERQFGDYRMALEYYTRAIALNPNSEAIQERVILLNKRKARSVEEK